MTTTKTTKTPAKVAARRRIKWPAAVWDVIPDDFERGLTEAEMSLFLSMLGQSYEAQPDFASKSEMAGHLHAEVGVDTIRSQAVYDLVCHGVLPKGTSPQPKGFFDNTVFWEGARSLVRGIIAADIDPAAVVTDVTAKVRSKVEERTNEVFDQLDEVVTRKLTGIETMVKDEVARRLNAAEKSVTRIEVSGSDGKVRQLPKVRHVKFDRIMQLAASRINIALVGPAGCGKTHIAEQIATTMGLRFGAQSMSAGVTESAFVGWLLPMGKGGEYTHVSSPFLDIYENGGLFLFDEADNADANMLVFLNMALGNKQFFLPQRRDNPVVKKSKDFVAAVAMNTYGNGADATYVGRAQLDGATMDRFRTGMVEMTYDRAIEAAVSDADTCKWGWNVREAIERNRLRRILSTRTLIDIANVRAKWGWSLSQAAEGYWADWSVDERRLMPASVAAPNVAKV